jgi:beta-glucosidase
VRWTGTLTPPAPGDYFLGGRVAPCYACESHEEFRLYVDDKLVAEATEERGAEGRVRFDDTKPHALRLEYRHGTAAAGIDLNWRPPAPALVAEAVAAAKESEVVVALVGLSPQLEGEEMPVELEGFKGGDRTDIRLPKAQRDLLQALNATGKPLVVVLTSGSALAVPEEDGYARAVLEAWYPGEEGGTAIAETLAGDNNPAGRLPLTFYASTDQLPPFEEYSMADRTYRYFTGKPLYGFGYGLSYSRFEYANLKAPKASVAAGDPVTVEVDVRNAGARDGDEVVEAYLTQPKAALTPIHTLAAFTRVHVKAGQTAHVSLRIDPRTLGQVDEKGERVIVPGTYAVAVGGAQPAEFPGAAKTTFEVTGSKTLPR